MALIAPAAEATRKTRRAAVDYQDVVPALRDRWIREVPVSVAGEPVNAVMVCCKLAAPLTISDIFINDSNYSLSKYLQHRAKWRQLESGPAITTNVICHSIGPGGPSELSDK